MERSVHTNEDGSLTMTEDGVSATVLRDPDMDEAAWLARVDEAAADFFTPVDADGEPKEGFALWWHRVVPAWMR